MNRRSVEGRDNPGVIKHRGEWFCEDCYEYVDPELHDEYGYSGEDDEDLDNDD